MAHGMDARQLVEGQSVAYPGYNIFPLGLRQVVPVGNSVARAGVTGEADSGP